MTEKLAMSERVDGHTGGDEWTVGADRVAGVWIEGSLGEQIALVPFPDRAVSKANARLLALSRYAPHDCDVPDCPGPEVKRKVEAYEGLVEALKQIEDATEGIPDQSSEIAHSLAVHGRTKAEGREG
jgi:hypothetical protein